MKIGIIYGKLHHRMNREQANKIIREGDTTRGNLARRFNGYHPYTVAEALVIWAQTVDCPSELSKKLDGLRDLLEHLPEYKKENENNKRTTSKTQKKIRTTEA